MPVLTSTKGPRPDKAPVIPASALGECSFWIGIDNLAPLWHMPIAPSALLPVLAAQSVAVVRTLAPVH